MEELLRTAALKRVVLCPLSNARGAWKTGGLDRFGVKEDNNGLKDASLKSKAPFLNRMNGALICPPTLLSLTWLVYQRKWRAACVPTSRHSMQTVNETCRAFRSAILMTGVYRASILYLPG